MNVSFCNGLGNENESSDTQMKEPSTNPYFPIILILSSLLSKQIQYQLFSGGLHPPPMNQQESQNLSGARKTWNTMILAHSGLSLSRESSAKWDAVQHCQAVLESHCFPLPTSGQPWSAGSQGHGSFHSSPTQSACGSEAQAFTIWGNWSHPLFPILLWGHPSVL